MWNTENSWWEQNVIQPISRFIRQNLAKLKTCKTLQTRVLLLDTNSRKSSDPAWCSVMTQMGGMGVRGGREAQEGGVISIQVAGALYCTAETNTTLQSNHMPV